MKCFSVVPLLFTFALLNPTFSLAQQPTTMSAKVLPNFHSALACSLETLSTSAALFQAPPDQLGPEHIREYQAFLFRERKLAARTVA